MEGKIQEQLAGRKPSEVNVLILDTCTSSNIVGLSEKFENLEILSLINVGLTSLVDFPKLTSLKKLLLSENKLSGGFEPLCVLENLTHLKLAGNNIKEFSSLEALKKLKNLKSLDLLNCEVSKIDNYREKVFELIPSLVYLDGVDAEEKSECEGEEDEDDDSDDDLEGEDDDDDLDEEEDLDEEFEEGEDVPLTALYSEYNPEGDDDYEEGEEEEDEDIDEGDADASTDKAEGENGRGTKRKHEGEN